MRKPNATGDSGTIAGDRMILKALFGMLDDYLLREMIGFVSNSMIEMEVEELTGAAYGEA